MTFWTDNSKYSALSEQEAGILDFRDTILGGRFWVYIISCFRMTWKKDFYFQNLII